MELLISLVVAMNATTCTVDSNAMVYVPDLVVVTVVFGILVALSGALVNALALGEPRPVCPLDAEFVDTKQSSVLVFTIVLAIMTLLFVLLLCQSPRGGGGKRISLEFLALYNFVTSIFISAWINSAITDFFACGDLASATSTILAALMLILLAVGFVAQRTALAQP